MSTTNNLLKEQALALIASGIDTAAVASACGVSESYISQLRQATDKQQDEEPAGLSVADQEFDSRLERAESLALERIEKSIGFANMGQALNAFRVLNSARKRKEAVGLGAAAGTGNVSVTVNLTMPSNGLARYVTNSANEIVEVEGKTMISATAKSLDAILASRAAGNTSVPQITHLEKAANKLDGLRPPPFRQARRLPAELSVDVL